MPATYLNRPLFDWPVDWARMPLARIEYNLNEIALGFGPESYWSDQVDVVHGWHFEVHLDSETAVDEFDRWFEGLTGRLVGFWMPTPLAAFQVVAGISMTQFKVKAQDLAGTLGSQPELHVWFAREGSEPFAAKVESVTDNGDGTETVTLSAAAPVAVDSTWQAWVLQYVRLAEDIERGTFDSEQHASRTVRVVELPREYASYETGSKPIYFYHFFTDQGGAQVDWRYTSFGWDLEANEVLWTAARITHQQFSRNTRGDRPEVIVQAEFMPTSPLYQMCPAALAMPLNIVIRSADWGDILNQEILFAGRVMSVDVEGKKVSAKCSSFIDIQGATVPHFFLQPRCNHRVFEPKTCRASQAAYQVSATVASFDGRAVVVTGPSLAGAVVNWFAEGWIEVGAAATFERRTILASSAESGNSVLLTLHMPFFYAETGGACLVVPGCDGRADTCKAKFANFPNFGGHGQAVKNLALKALEIPEVDMGKK